MIDLIIICLKKWESLKQELERESNNTIVVKEEKV